MPHEGTGARPLLPRALTQPLVPCTPSLPAGEAMRQRLRRITSEVGTLARSLPLEHGTGVLLAVDEQRLDVLRAVLLPAPDTP